AKLALMPQDSPTRFKGKPGIGKEVAWAEPLPLEEIKTVAKALGASINDVLLSCVAGPRAGAGQPAPDRGGLASRQPVRAGVSRSADRHWQSGGTALRGAGEHECAQGELPARRRAGPARRDGRRAAGAAGGTV